MSTTDSRSRSLLKALSWRMVALAVTAVVSYVVTGSLALAASIGLADSAIKIFAYYSHERAWENVSFGRGRDPSQGPSRHDDTAREDESTVRLDDPLCAEVERAA